MTGAPSAVRTRFSPPVVFRPERLGADAALSLITASMAVMASLPGCETADFLPCPCELPEIGRC